MSNIFIKLSVSSKSASVQLDSSNISKIYTSVDYEYKYWPFKNNLFSNDLSDVLRSKSNSIFSIGDNYLKFSDNIENSALNTNYLPGDKSVFFMSGVFSVSEFPTSGIGMLLGNFNNPSSKQLGASFYVNTNKNLSISAHGSGKAITALSQLNSPFYVSAISDNSKNKMEYLVVVGGVASSGIVSYATFTDSEIEVSVGNTMHAARGGGVYSCHDLVVDRLNRYSKLEEYYSDAKERMNKKGIQI